MVAPHSGGRRAYLSRDGGAGERRDAEQDDGHPADEVGEDDDGHAARHGAVALLVGPASRDDGPARPASDAEHPRVGDEDGDERDAVEGDEHEDGVLPAAVFLRRQVQRQTHPASAAECRRRV